VATDFFEFPVIPAADKPCRAFYFLRHGETQYNREGRFQGRIDAPLNDTGLQQADQAAKRMLQCGIARIVASPARRVLQTAEAVANLGMATIEVDDDLMEFYVGSFESQSVKAIRKDHELGEHESIFSVLPDDADRWQEFVPRVVATVRRWTEKYADETVLIAAHGLVFRSLALVLTGEAAVSRNAEPFLFTPDGTRYTIDTVKPDESD